MSKSKVAFYVLLGISCAFAFCSIWISFACGLIVWHIDNSDLTWNLVTYGVYYISNAILCLFLGILAGLNVKKRFYAPVITTVCLLPTLLLFRYYTEIWDWLCIATTLSVGIIAMMVSAAVTKKKAQISIAVTSKEAISSQS